MVTCKHYTLYYYDGIINELEISKRVRILCMDLWANRKKKKKYEFVEKKKTGDSIWSVWDWSRRANGEARVIDDRS